MSPERSSFPERERLYASAFQALGEGYIAALTDDDRYPDRNALRDARLRLVDAIEAVLFFAAEARIEFDELNARVDLERDLLRLGIPADPPGLPGWPPRSSRPTISLDVPISSTAPPSTARRGSPVRRTRKVTAR